MRCFGLVGLVGLVVAVWFVGTVFEVEVEVEIEIEFGAIGGVVLDFEGVREVEVDAEGAEGRMLYG